MQNQQRDSSIKGIMYMLAAMLVYSLVNALVKDTTTRYPLVQLVFFRSFFALVPGSLLLLKAGGTKAMKTQHLPRLVLCAMVGSVAFTCLFSSLRLLPLADAVTLIFSETLFLTAFAAIYLHEHVGIHRWLAVIIGFMGVIFISRPTGEVFNIGVLHGIFFALGDAFFMINARVMTRTDHSATIVVYFFLFISIISGVILPFVWVTPTWQDTLILIFLGIGGGIGQICVTQAYRYASAATVAPMIYSALLWGVLFGFVFWGEIPDLILLIGSSLIIGSGLYVVFREVR